MYFVIDTPSKYNDTNGDMKITIMKDGETITTYDSTTHPRIGELVVVDSGGMKYNEGRVRVVENHVFKGLAEVFVTIK